MDVSGAAGRPVEVQPRVDSVDEPIPYELTDQAVQLLDGGHGYWEAGDY